MILALPALGSGAIRVCAERVTCWRMGSLSTAMDGKIVRAAAIFARKALLERAAARFGANGLLGTKEKAVNSFSRVQPRSPPPRLGLRAHTPSSKRIFRGPLVSGVASLLPILANQEAET